MLRARLLKEDISSGVTAAVCRRILVGQA